MPSFDCSKVADSADSTLPLEEVLQQNLVLPLRAQNELLPGKAPGSFVISVVDGGTFYVRAERDKVELGTGRPADAILVVLASDPDLRAWLAAALPHLGKSAVTRELLLGPFLLDEARAGAIRGAEGTLRFTVKGQPDRRVAFAAGDRSPDLENPRAELTCSWSDFERMLRGEVAPIDLFFDGRLVASGDLELTLLFAGAAL